MRTLDYNLLQNENFSLERPYNDMEEMATMKISAGDTNIFTEWIICRILRTKRSHRRA